MKAITLWEPWATLIAHGYKKFETRSWQTLYRGPLLIHAAKRIPRKGELRGQDYVLSTLRDIGIETIGDLHFGCALAIVDLDKIFRTEDVRHTQRIFGDFGPGRYAWKLTNVRRLPSPLPMRGRKGLWNFKPDFDY